MLLVAGKFYGIHLNFSALIWMKFLKLNWLEFIQNAVRFKAAWNTIWVVSIRCNLLQQNNFYLEMFNFSNEKIPIEMSHTNNWELCYIIYELRWKILAQSLYFWFCWTLNSYLKFSV